MLAAKTVLLVPYWIDFPNRKIDLEGGSIDLTRGLLSCELESGITELTGLQREF